MINVMERFLQGKVSLEKCEDNIVVTDDFAAVIDGATSQSDISVGGKTAGALAAGIVAEAITTLPAEAGLAETAQHVTAAIRRCSERLGLWNVEELQQHPERRLTASAAVYSRHLRQVWLVGDCQCLVGGKLWTNAKKIDTLMAESRAAFIAAELLKGASAEDFLIHDRGREFIRPFLKSQPIFQNSPQGGEYAFSVFDGFPVLLDHVKTVPVTEGTQVVLASDGYPCLHSTLEASERSLRSLLERDPLCIGEYRATKGVRRGQSSFDDRAYLSFLA